MATPNYALPEGAVIEYVPEEQSQPAASQAPQEAPAAAGPLPAAPDPMPMEPEQPADFMGLAPAKDATELRQGLDTLMQLRAPLPTVRGYITASGFQLNPKDDKFLENAYPKFLASNPKGGAGINWQIKTRPAEISNAESAWSGLKSGALLGFDDELYALSGAVGNKIGSALGLNETEAGFGDVYSQILDKARTHKDEAYRQNPFAYGAGFVPGAVLTAPLAGGNITRGATTAGRVANVAVAGGKMGAVNEAGNYEGDGGVVERIQEMPMGYVKGAAGGVASYPVAAVGSNIIERVLSRVSPAARRETSGLDALDFRAPQDPAAMRAAADDMTSAGVPPRLLDVVDESGRGVVRDSASKMTPARDAVTQHADTVAADAQDRVARQAYTHIADNPQTARVVAEDLTAARGTAMEDAMAPIRNDVVPITTEVADILATREGQAALRGAEGLLTSPADRAVVRQLLAAARKHAKGPTDPEDLFRAEVNGWDELPEAVKAAYRQQRPDLMQQVDPFADANLTVDLADKIARAMKGRAAKTPGLERVANDFGNTIRGEARKGSPAYDEAVNNYSSQSRVIDAAEGTGRYQDTNFLDTPADPFGRTVAAADASVPPGAPMSEVDALRVRARDQVVERATGGSGQNAPAVARQLSRGTAQQAKNEALLGPTGARAMEKSMGYEAERVANTRFIDPRTGSATFGRAQDAIVDGAADAMANAATTHNPWWGVVRTAASWLRKGGIRDVDAERLARQAISEDPAELRAAIDYLEKRGMKRERGEKFLANMAAALGARSATKSDRKSEPLNSVRAVMREAGRN